MDLNIAFKRKDCLAALYYRKICVTYKIKKISSQKKKKKDNTVKMSQPNTETRDIQTTSYFAGRRNG